jgi:spore germination protein KA
LILPATLIQFLQTSEDYYERYSTTLFIRSIRLIFFVISLLLPGCFVAIISYHKEMIPTPLLISIIGAAHGVPFPIFIEALLMEIAFEALREAGIRLPSPANQTVGIVGALVIGDAAVRAGVTSPIMVIIIATTAIASFSIPSYDMGYAIRILRFSMLCLGIFGVIWNYAWHYCTFNSFIIIKVLRRKLSFPTSTFKFKGTQRCSNKIPLDPYEMQTSLCQH